VRAIEWPADVDMGETFYSIGLIKGGVAPNVISPEADAELMFRTVGPETELRRRLDDAIGALVAIDEILVVPPVRFTALPGFDTAVFSFTTDVPFLDRWGAPLLVGPGSITVAHTADEHVAVEELERGVQLYERIARQVLAS
jgi:acetylornithine deacetylase